MTDEILLHHETTMVRRLRLAPGEAMPWHRDPFHRVAVVLSGDVLSIEYRDGRESQRVTAAILWDKFWDKQFGRLEPCWIQQLRKVW